MGTKKQITVILVLLALGLGTEALKKFNLIGSKKPTGIESVNVAGMDVTPYYRGNQENDVRPEKNQLKKAFTLAGIGSATEGGKDFGKDTKKKADAKKKKKKKKKKAKAKELQTFDNFNGQTDVYKEDEDSKKQSEDEVAADAGNPGAAIAQKPDDNVENKNSFEEWARRLLGRANKDEVNNFIREYQTGNISVQVFYQILQAMYDKNTDEFKSLSILAAGATPSALSFNFLVQAFIDSGSNSSEVNSLVSSELRDYEILQHIWVANSALISTTDLQTAYIAANAFNESTRRYLEVSNQNGATQNAGQRGLRTTISNRNPSSNEEVALRYFQSYLGTLQSALSRYADEPQISDALNAAINRIQSQSVAAPVVAQN